MFHRLRGMCTLLKVCICFQIWGGGSRVHSMVELCSTKTARVTATLHLLRAEAQARVHADAAVLQRQLRTVLAQRGQEDLGGSLS
jgi:hypothetical protein